jgi:dolichol-phosphate mannosyltransferase
MTDMLHLIVPVFNEQENFPRLVAEVERHAPRPYRLLVVYDFEEDSTLPVARELAAQHPEIELVKNELGRGPANAIRAGFAAVSAGPACVVMADLSDDLSLLPAMLAAYRQGAQVVCPSRYMTGGRQLGGPRVKRILSRLAGLSLYWLARFPVHDATNNFRLYDAALVRELGIESERGFEIALELTAKAFARGCRIVELPATWRDRTAGASNFKLLKWLPHYLRWYWYVWRHAWWGRWRRVRRPLPPVPTLPAEPPSPQDSPPPS